MPAIANQGFTGTTGGSLRDRKRKVALTGDETDQLRGSSTVLTPQGQAKNHRLQSGNYPRRQSVSRDVTVTTASGNVYTLNSRLQSKHKVRVAEETTTKRTLFAQGAEYAETWQSHDNDAPKADSKVAYYFRGEYYNSLDEYLGAIDAIG